MIFYIINNDTFDDSTYAYGEDFGEINLGKADHCEICESTLTSLKWLPPHEIRVSKKKIGDFIFGTFGNFIVSEKFKVLFEEEKLKGIRSFQPVALYFRKNLLDEKYYYPEIIMSDFFVDLEKSGFEFEGNKRCPACQKAGSIIKKWNGVIFEQPDEVNLDVFNTKVLGETPIVSERFRDFIIEHEFSNISLIEASKYETTWTTSQT